MYVFASGRGGRCWGEWVSGLGLGFTNPGGTGGKYDMCLCIDCGGVGGVGVGVGWRLGPGSVRVVCC